MRDNVEDARESLWFIADQLQSWLDWDKRHREDEGLTTTRDTHIMSLPVPFWPNHGTMEHWIKTLQTASGHEHHPYRRLTSPHTPSPSG